MNNFHIIGSGCCGFLRIHHMLKSYIPLKYKGGGPKYQNSFEQWNENNGLVWDAYKLSKEEKLRRVSLHDLTTNITHSYLPYVEEFIKINPNVKFLCFKGQKEHSIKSLTTSWAYRNPCFVSDRTVGREHNRYAVSQFPNFSDSLNVFDATEKYWNLYYKTADKLQEQFPSNFLIVNSPRFFSDRAYQKECLSFVDLSIPYYHSPVDFDSWNISTTLHGGLGNNLFQMSEAIAFCKENNLPEPVFGTWDLWNGGNKYPNNYNSDRFLGGHVGSHELLKKCFTNLNWKETLQADYDTKFVINDMFRFSDINHMRRDILDTFQPSNNLKEQLREKYSHLFKKECVSVHIRTCTLPADDHLNGFVPDDFYFEVFKNFPDNYNFLVFSDNQKIANEKISNFSFQTNKKFVLINEDVFSTLAMMSMCQHYILHISTLSFWGAYLNNNIENSKVLYYKSWLNGHGKNMIPFSNWETK